MPRSSSTVSAKAQTLLPVRFFQLSLAQVSLPGSPGCGNGVERPELLAGADVVAVLIGNLPARLIELRTDVPLARPVEIGPDQQHVLVDGGRAVVGHGQVDFAFLAEARIDLAGLARSAPSSCAPVVKMMRGGLLRSPGQ